MKKKISFPLVFTYLILSTILLVSCNGTSNRECTHSYGKWSITKEATCTSEGTQSRTCELCGYLETEYIPIISHTEITDTLQPATCTNTGLTEGKHCSICNAVFVARQTIPALGHSYQESITSDASCSQNGTKKFTCEKCNDTYTESFSLTEYSANEVFESSKYSVGEIITYDESGAELALGTGFIYSDDGKIITNYHVIEDAYSAKITINGNTYDIQYILSYDKTIDIAVLQIEANNLTALPICYSEHAVGKTVYSFGSSRGLTSTFSQGIITYSNREVDGVTYVQHDGAISSGNSGGPLINQYGEVIGINTWTVNDSQNLNFAIATTELNNLVYDTPLTVSEFYEKECDVFTKLKNHIIKNGSYDSENAEYTLTLESAYSSDYSSLHTRLAYYDTAKDEIEFCYILDTDCLIFISIDEIDGVYDWAYYDSSDYYMFGTLYATTYDSDSLLGYATSNIYSSVLRSTIRELASAMVDVLCSLINSDYSSIGVTAKDLGFLNY